MDMNVNTTVASFQSQFQTQMHAPDRIVSEREAIERALIWSSQAFERLRHKRKNGEVPHPSNEDDSEDVSDDGVLEEPLNQTHSSQSAGSRETGTARQDRATPCRTCSRKYTEDGSRRLTICAPSS
ncbi:hypothetical protein EDD17DRAFT_1878130 [Pisolithus thermaeus]|nr:hypothetical protein EDD17DRAFT_1878130 [Pisolithus thermaeus]